MARDGSGNYSLAAGNPVVTGTSISSTWANNTMNDLASAMTQSVSKDGQTAFTGTLNLGNNAISNGASITGASFIPTGSGIPTNGLYLPAANNVGWAINGSNAASLVATSFTAPAFIPTSSTVPANGMYLSAANTLAWSTNTILRHSINSTGNHVFAAPTAGIAVAVSGFAGSAVLSLTGSGTGTVQAYTDGTRTAALATVAGGYELKVTSAHTLALGANNTVQMTFATTGGINIPVPSSGVAISVTGVSGNRPAVFNGAGTTSASAVAIYEPLFSIAANTLAATYETGTFTGTLTGCTTAPTATFNYTRVANTVTIDCSAGLTATSNSVSCTVTGLPAALTPARTQNVGSAGHTESGTANTAGGVTISGTTITLTVGTVAATRLNYSSAGFTNTGTKGVSAGLTFTYTLT